jgi:AraC-like DNA-binding protein
MTPDTRDTDAYPRMYLYRRLVQAKLFIDSHFSIAINVDNIADEAYFSKFHFIRLFKKTYGRTPHQYLTWVRIEKAKYLLKTGAPIADVCFAVGFESISSFTGLFKRTVRQTPYNYQLQQRSTQADTLKRPLKYIPGCMAIKQGWQKKEQY